jgi:hypothetical protein
MSDSPGEAALRILIAGPPRCGKTTLGRELAAALAVPLRSTDDLIGSVAMAEAGQAVAAWLEEPGPWVIEGVTVPRAIRCWLRSHPIGRPCDRLLWSPRPRVILTRGQAAMARGVATVFGQVVGELARRGLPVEVF